MHAVLTQSAQQQVGELLKKSVPLVTAKLQYTPFKTKFINTFNISGSYINYVIPAVYILILQQTMLIGMGMLGAAQGARSRRGERGYYNNNSVSSVMVARVISFGSIYLLHLLFFFGFMFSFFGVPHIAKIGELLLFSLSFLLAVSALGLLLGALFKERVYPTPIILLSSLPLVFSAGFIWPLEMMPSWLVWLANISPTTPGIQGFLRLNQMGASFDQVIGQFALLWLQIIVYTLAAYLILRHQRKYMPDVA